LFTSLGITTLHRHEQQYRIYHCVDIGKVAGLILSVQVFLNPSAQMY
jgi:hypothetical protein